MALPRVVQLLTVFVSALFAAGLPAHGGQYRGQGDPTVGPVTGGPMGPSSPGPLTGARPGASDSTSWQVWWEFNKDPLLGRRGVFGATPASGSDEFFLGARRPDSDRDPLAPSASDRRDRIAKALLEALRGSTNPDILTACMVALAKVGIDPPDARLPDVFAQHLAAGDQEVRETAALAMGIAGQVAALDRLAGLLAETPAGRDLAGRESVPERTRTFAAWSLGLVAHRAADPAVKQKVHDLILPHLKNPEEKSRDLRVALVNALGLLGTDPARSPAERRLLWQTLGELWDFYALDLGKGNQLIQAHVPIAAARLLGRGSSAEHQKWKRLLLGELGSSVRRQNAIYQSAALALGSLCLPAESDGDEAGFSAALLRYYKEGSDQQTRFFCVISLGRIGGDQNRRALLGIYDAANKATEKPWVALALGLIAYTRPRDQGARHVDEEVGRMLLRDIQSIDNNDTQAALALAIGLCGYREAADVVTALLYKNAREDVLAGYAAVGLALLDHDPAADALADLMQKSVRRPFLLQQCAVGLGRLGDARTVPILQDLLQKSESTATLSAIANALGFIHDRRSIDPLIVALRNDDLSKLARAFAAAALGGVGDKDPLPWNTKVAVDMNYQARVDTLTNGRTGVLDIL